MRFTRYQARGETTDASVIGLLKGAVRSVTGWIGRYNGSSYQIRTPTATIGVRGTDHETLVIPQGQGNDGAGTYDKVNIGGTTMETKHGKVDVEPNRAGFASHRGGARPQLLAQVPRFFKPTRHEAVFRESMRRSTRRSICIARKGARFGRKRQPRCTRRKRSGGISIGRTPGKCR